MPIGTYIVIITQKKFSIFYFFFRFRCILLQISHKKCFFISISILGRSGVKGSGAYVTRENFANMAQFGLFWCIF